MTNPEDNGDGPRGWVTVPVGSVGGVRVGKQRSPGAQTGRHPTPYIRAANITPAGLDLSDLFTMDFSPAERRTFSLRQGDVVLTEASGSAAQVGRAALWPAQAPECCFQNTVVRFRSHAASPRYALVVFRHFAASGTFARTARGVGIQHLGVTRFAALPFPLPPLAEQDRIAAEVEVRMSGIEEARASLTSALARVREQEREIVAAAARGRLLTKNEDGGATPSGAARPPAPNAKDGGQRLLFEGAHGEEAWSDPLPAGWRWVRIDEAGELKLGRQRSSARRGGGSPTAYLRVANVQEDAIATDDLATMDFTPAEQEAYAVHPGDILLNVGQSPELVGRPALVREDLGRLAFQNHLARFRPRPGIDGEYALLVFRHYLHSGLFRSVATWSTNLATLGLGRLAALPFPLPPPETQSRIAAEAARRLEASRSQAQAIRAALEKLPTLEAELLTAAVRGTLVPQDPSDEPASVLLERLGPVPVDADRAAKGGTEDPPSAEDPTVDTAAKYDDDPVAAGGRLAASLRAAGRPLPLPDLLARAGYDGAAVDDVERFYLALREELECTVRVVGDAVENAVLEAVPNAA
ncbi:restriction endonuclease subunit S [Sediminicoccus rosea]|uniref:Restriction endonuclease subunit S n=1 Tax=Sediminicoccus rosea TaxID=1225128 RepID=A0ABZ0PNI3_9PROT|nr:restriction endonuclease subunit S [Sediminicoccus rosea]WPB86922.1 restriction endonuclease subunit S [Sediminicoccus rosea]